ncbi:MAG: DUF411 domain-containing protein [Gemmatimonadales bacterium]|nr:DUF411 domain-containing protein [Gemmatimonadales bacterium]
MNPASRKTAMIGALLVLAIGVSASVAIVQRPAPSGPAIMVYKTATCGCCSKWIEHLKDHGFTVTAEDVTQKELILLKRDAGVPQELGSCHTAIVDGYAIEGHVPADVILGFLEEHPKAVGLAVPGMPLGSPGMPSDVKEPYDVLQFNASGETKVYTSH